MKRQIINQNYLHTGLSELKKRELSSYILIDKPILNFKESFDFALYTAKEESEMLLFLNRGQLIGSKWSEISLVDDFFIREDDKENYQAYVKIHLQNMIRDDTIPLDVKTDLIYKISKDEAYKLYHNLDTLESLHAVEVIVEPILESLLHKGGAIFSYMKIIEHDYYTHTHSLNVSIYSLTLGTVLNINETTLKFLGESALLHDLGKSRIRSSIVNKESKLTPDELEVMMRHPLYGYELAMEMGIKNSKILDGIRHHHEMLDGMGYPDHLKGAEISLFPRIIGVCDVFDALTTRRSYKEAMSSYDALHLMKAHMNHHLDMRIVNAFIKLLHS